MHRVNPTSFYRFGRALAVINWLKTDSEISGDVQRNLVLAYINLDVLAVKGTVFTISEKTRRSAEKLSTLLKAISSRERKGLLIGGNPLGDDDASSLRENFVEFETLYAADCEKLNIFNVPDALAYNSSILIGAGFKTIPPSLHLALTDEIKKDLSEATKALVFELPTSSAFHMARATEGTMRRYHEGFIGPLQTTYQQQTWGSLTAAFRSANLNPALVDFLDHVKTNYRNPVSHPEEVVSPEEGFKLLDIYKAVIIDMLNDIMGDAAAKNRLGIN